MLRPWREVPSSPDAQLRLTAGVDGRTVAIGLGGRVAMFTLEQLAAFVEKLRTAVLAAGVGGRTVAIGLDDATASAGSRREVVLTRKQFTAFVKELRAVVRELRAEESRVH